MEKEFNIGHAITHSYREPGDVRFNIKLALWLTAFMLIWFALLGKLVFDLTVSEEDREAFFVFFGLLLPLTLILWAVIASIETAFHRRKFFQIDGGVIPFRFGQTEVFVMLAQFALMLIFVGLYILLIVALVGGGIIASSIIGEQSAAVMVLAVLAVILVLGWLALFVFMFIRFWPAAALTVKTNDVQILKAWQISKGRFWYMFGSYFLTYVAGYIVLQIILYSFSAILFGNSEFARTIGGFNPNVDVDFFTDLQASLEPLSAKITLAIGAFLYLLLNSFWMIALWGIPNYLVSLRSETEA